MIVFFYEKHAAKSPDPAQPPGAGCACPVGRPPPVRTGRDVREGPHDRGRPDRILPVLCGCSFAALLRSQLVTAY